MEKETGTCLKIKCNTREAEFYLQKTILNCIKYNSRWISPPEFENMCGLQGRKWKTNIKFEGRPIGQWLTEHNMELSSQRSNCSEALEQVQVQGVDTSTHVDLSPSTNDIDLGLTSHTRLPTNVSTSKGRQDIVSPQRPSLQHPSVPEEIQPEHTVNQTTSEVEASSEMKFTHYKC